MLGGEPGGVGEVCVTDDPVDPQPVKITNSPKIARLFFILLSRQKSNIHFRSVGNAPAGRGFQRADKGFHYVGVELRARATA